MVVVVVTIIIIIVIVIIIIIVIIPRLRSPQLDTPDSSVRLCRRIAS